MSRILLLSQEVVDRIAAGEVVVRPMNAVKELVENSLDAGATQITVSIRRGGLDFIKVQDNGSGIDPEDMPIVCARFATSKLREFDDLNRMSTFGFRGEALASISYVANVTITTKRADDICAYKASYQDGNMVGALGRSAGLKGTVISAENLFYNSLARRRALKYPQEEAIRILDLLVKYAIEYPHVAFALRRLDSSASDFCSAGVGDRNATIHALLGARVSKELLNYDFSGSDELHFSFRATFSAPVSSHTSTAIQSRKDRYKSFHLFINGRCVDSPRIKQSVDLVFAAKDSVCQFINISLKIDPSHVDVNVHPTKAIVHFLNEDKIIQVIEEEMFKAVNEFCSTGMIEVDKVTKNNANVSANDPASANSGGENLNAVANQPDSRGNDFISKRVASETNFASQEQKPAVKRLRISDFEATSMRKNNSLANTNRGNSNATIVSAAPSSSSSTLSAQRVRIDPDNRRLDEFVAPGGFANKDGTNENSTTGVRLMTDTHMIFLNDSTTTNSPPTTAADGNEHHNEVPTNAFFTEDQSLSRTFQSESLDRLRRAICADADPTLIALFRRHHFVGAYGRGGYGIFQTDNEAHVVQLDAFLREFFYQFVIFSFGNMGSYRLKIGANGSSSETNADCNLQNNDKMLDKREENSRHGLRIRDLLKLYYKARNLSAADEAMKVDAAIANIVSLSKLLWDYFSLGIDVINLKAQKKQQKSNNADVICNDNDIAENDTGDQRHNEERANHNDTENRIDDVPSNENNEKTSANNYGNGVELFLKRIPCAINGYVPPLESLPELVANLGNIDCSEEEKCFKEIARALASFFTPSIAELDADEGDDKADAELIRDSLWRFVLPTAKLKFLPPFYLKKYAQKITSIELAFKNFGRC